jgi:prepilin signal peptidase PulO-like enzyme (type II secretory pathway)
MTLLFYVGSAGLGLILGSFLSMLIPRLHHREKGIIAGRSHCPYCKHTLGFESLIPLLSYTLQRGKCSWCKKNISAWYPLTELLTALSCLGMAFHFQDPKTWVFFLPILFTFLFIFFYDLRYKEIHEAVLIPGILYAFFWALLFQDLQSALLGAGFAFSFFGLQYALSKGRWLGSGDLEIGIFMGLVLGFQNTLIGLFTSYLLGSLIGIGLMLFKKAERDTAVPLGPFLVLGSMLSYLHGNDWFSFYMNLLSL